MKITLGIYFSVFAFVLTFIITRGKIIEGAVIFRRMFFNAVIFFIIGTGLQFLYQKFFVKEPETEDQASDKDTEKKDIADENTSHGASLDVTVGDDDLTAEVVGRVSEDNPGETQTSETSGNYVPPPPKKTSMSDDGKAKVDGDFIVYDDKKIPNDPKLIAQAIKTKLADE